MNNPIELSVKEQIRRSKDAETLKTADRYREFYDEEEDRQILNNTDNMALALKFGRVYSSVIQRRAVLHRLFAQGLTLAEIHAAEKAEREHRNRIKLRNAIRQIESCPDCYCSPCAATCNLN